MPPVTGESMSTGHLYQCCTSPDGECACDLDCTCECRGCDCREDL